MIHTFKMYFPLYYQDVQDLQKRLGIKYTEVNQYLLNDFSGVTMSISNAGKGQWRFYLVIDTIKLLEKPNLTDEDYPKIEKQLRYILYCVLGHSSCYKDHVLLRIDYRYDVVIRDSVIRQLLIDLYKKMTRSYCRQHKRTGYKDKKTGEYVHYETSVDHKSESVKTMVYLKDEENKAKGRGNPPEYEKDVVRYEVQMENGRLYYLEVEKGLPRKLWTYFKRKIFLEHFQKYMLPIYHQGTFFKVDEARNIIYKSSLTLKNKEKLVDFLKKVSSFDLDTPLKAMTKETRKRRLQMLSDLGINPVPIPKNYPHAPLSLENPLDIFLSNNFEAVQ